MVIEQLASEEAEKRKIQSELEALTKRLAQVNDSISKNVRGRAA